MTSIRLCRMMCEMKLNKGYDEELGICRVLFCLHSQIQKRKMPSIIQSVKRTYQETEVMKMLKFKNVLSVVVIVASIVTSMCGVLGAGADLVEQIKK